MVMNAIFGFIGALWIFTALVHATLGGREVLRPVLQGDVSQTAKGTMQVAWHLLTWQFFVLGGLGGGVLFMPAQRAAYGTLSAALSGGFALLFLVYGIQRFGNPWRLPQWMLFLPILGLSIASLLGAGPLPTVAFVARIAAVTLIVSIALLHVAWALGSSFPAHSRGTLALHVIGSREGEARMPGRIATWLVALLLFAAGACLLAAGSLHGIVAEMQRFIAAALVLAFLLRGVGGFLEPAVRRSIAGTPYGLWSRFLYSPLALLLALLIGVSAYG